MIGEDHTVHLILVNSSNYTSTDAKQSGFAREVRRRPTSRDMLNGIVPRDWSEPELFLTKRIYVVLPNNFLFPLNHFSFFTKLANAVNFFNNVRIIWGLVNYYILLRYPNVTYYTVETITFYS